MKEFFRMIKEFLITLKETLFWLFMLIFLIVILICNQYAGYRQAEKNIMKSCVANDKFEIEGIEFVCIKCPKRNNNDKK